MPTKMFSKDDVEAFVGLNKYLTGTWGWSEVELALHLLPLPLVEAQLATHTCSHVHSWSTGL